MDVEEEIVETEPLLREEDTLTQRRSLKHSLWRYGFILPALFFAVLGANLVIFVLMEWTQYKLKKDAFQNTNGTESNSDCTNQNKSDPMCIKYQEVQKDSAKWIMMYNICEMLPAIFALLVFPSCMDSYGRKFLLFLTMGGITVKGIVVTLVTYFEASFAFNFIGALLSGMTGSLFATFTAANALVADLTVPGNQRTTGLIITELMIFIATVLGSFLSGYLIGKDEVGYLYTSALGTIFCGLAVACVFFVPESLTNEKRTKRKSVLQTIKRMADFYISSEFKGKRTAYILLLLALALAMFCTVNRASIETLYFLGKPFCWNSNDIGIFTMVRSALTGIGGLGSLKLFQKCLSDPSIAIISILSNTISYFIEAFAQSTATIYLVAVSGMFSFVVAPIIASLMSSMTPADKQGSLFASTSAISAISTLISNLSQNAIYSATLSVMNGFVFFILGILTIVDVMFMVIYKCTNKEKLVLTSDQEITVEAKADKSGRTPIT